MEAANRSCAKCGETLPGNVSACPSCGEPVGNEPHPQGVIIVLLILLVAGFVFTGMVVRGFDARQDQLAKRWFGRGNRDLDRGAALQAVDEFQTALAYSQDNDEYRLRLALALMAAGRLEEARVHLLNLWEKRPGDARINLELARVYAGQGNQTNAIRYYHSAIFGIWENDPMKRRRAARYELVEYLLSHDQLAAAQSELLALAAERPLSSDDQLYLAKLLLSADEPDRALTQYAAVLKEKRGNVDAAMGAAEAAFQLGEYRSAANYAQIAHRNDPKLKAANTLLDVTEDLQRTDPLARGLSNSERARRAYSVYKDTLDELDTCAASHPDNVQLKDLGLKASTDFHKLRERTLRNDPDLRDSVVRWTYEAKVNTVQVCGSTENDPVLLLARKWEKGR